MSLRNEDYVAFLDESGQPDLSVVSGVFIPARWLRSAERRWRAFIRYELGRRSGRVETKSRDLVTGGGVALDAQATWTARTGQPISAAAAGRTFYKAALEHIAGIAEVRVLSVGVRSPRPLEAYRLWFWLTYAAIVERPQPPRPRLALAVIDGEDASFRDAQDLIAYRFYKSFRGVQPYVRAGNSWFVGGSVHQASHLAPFVQMADLLAGAARRAIAGGRYGSWYDTHLRQYGLAMGRDVEVSRHALHRLRALDPHDACGSGYGHALIAP